jgi:hypothetical protein
VIAYTYMMTTMIKKTIWAALIVIAVIAVHNYIVYYIPMTMEHRREARLGKENLGTYNIINDPISLERLIESMNPLRQVRQIGAGKIIEYDGPEFSSGPILF